MIVNMMMIPLGFDFPGAWNCHEFNNEKLLKIRMLCNSPLLPSLFGSPTARLLSDQHKSPETLSIALPRS
jgi:hypothetical protein